MDKLYASYMVIEVVDAYLGDLISQFLTVFWAVGLLPHVGFKACWKYFWS